MHKSVFLILPFLFSLVSCNGNETTGNNPSDVTETEIDYLACSFKDSEIKNDVQYGDYFYLYVPNATMTLTLTEYVTVVAGTTWTLSTDLSGISTIPSKKISLSEGNSPFYFLNLTDKNSDIKQYVFMVRRAPMFTVTFEGKGSYSQKIEEGHTISELPSGGSKSGYTFVEWNYDNTPIYNNCSITAKWENNTYIATIDPNGGTITQTTYLATYAKRFTFPEIIKTGYSVNYWSDTANAKFYDSYVTWNWASNRTFHPVWKANSYTISFTGESIDLPDQTVVFDAPFTLPSPTRDSYYFLGWYYGDTIVENGVWTYASNLTLTAKWVTKNIVIKTSVPTTSMSYTLTVMSDENTIFNTYTTPANCYFPIEYKYLHKIVDEKVYMCAGFTKTFNGEDYLNPGESFDKDTTIYMRWLECTGISNTYNFASNGDFTTFNSSKRFADKYLQCPFIGSYTLYYQCFDGDAPQDITIDGQSHKFFRAYTMPSSKYGDVERLESTRYYRTTFSVLTPGLVLYSGDAQSKTYSKYLYYNDHLSDIRFRISNCPTQVKDIDGKMGTFKEIGLPASGSIPEGYRFAGWYTEMNGGGKQLGTGSTVFIPYGNYSELSIYPYFIPEE